MEKNKPRTVGLQQVLDAASRASVQVSKWPEWKRRLSGLQMTADETKIKELEDEIDRSREAYRKLHRRVQQAESKAVKEVWDDILSYSRVTFVPIVSKILDMPMKDDESFWAYKQRLLGEIRRLKANDGHQNQ